MDVGVASCKDVNCNEDGLKINYNVNIAVNHTKM
jgi:hypothetical protein